MDRTVFSSAARTATANSDQQDTPDDKRGAIFYLNISAASGTTPTLDIKLQGKDPASGNWFDIQNASFAQKTAAGTDSLLVYPGAVETANRRVSNVLPNDWRAVATIAGTSPSFTFSLGVSFVS